MGLDDPKIAGTALTLLVALVSVLLLVIWSI
jgi:hypothetical protein